MLPIGYLLLSLSLLLHCQRCLRIVVDGDVVVIDDHNGLFAQSSTRSFVVDDDVIDRSDLASYCTLTWIPECRCCEECM